MIRFFLAVALTLCTACGSESYEFAVWLERAELHVDPARPADLARPDVLLDLSGGDVGHYLRLDGVWARPDPAGATMDLDLAFEDAVVFLPSFAPLSLALVNQSMANAELAVYCQSTMPLTIYIGSPGNPELTAVAIDDLVVFCP